ncbi:N-acetylglucosamine-6-phosphate deacetylase [Deinococcus petrolearius]|uniref:N-acetylglucosamine-6-phosphate deacetylase n=1 Tax=Deinococcus petrolearius TaxID=1751295 RepID=A0ABW1DJ44_9DEIO
MICTGKVWTASGWQEAQLLFGEAIQEIRPIRSGGEQYILPGFIDVHVHGGGGHDTMDGEAGVRGLARFHARHGTTSLLPTTITHPLPQVIGALRAVRQVQLDPRPQEAAVLGAHLEGPFLNPERLGAQPPQATLPTPAAVDQLLATRAVRVVTLAPELAGAAAAATQFAAAGVRVSLGHTQGRAEDAQAVMQAVFEQGGEAGGTHLYNAMTGLSGREPGVVGALLAEPRAYAELILDFQHVHPQSAAAVFRAKPDHTLLVTDAMRAAGLPDGTYDLGGQPVEVVGPQARLAAGSSNPGTLAGSVLTMDAALRGAVACGLSLHQAAGLASAVPARYLGLRDRGRLVPGLRADLVVLDADLQVRQVYLGGRPLF